MAFSAVESGTRTGTIRKENVFLGRCQIATKNNLRVATTRLKQIANTAQKTANQNAVVKQSIASSHIANPKIVIAVPFAVFISPNIPAENIANGYRLVHCKRVPPRSRISTDAQNPKKYSRALPQKFVGTPPESS